MSRNNAYSDNNEKLKHYAAIAACMDQKLDIIIGRGTFTVHTLHQLSVDPLANMDMDDTTGEPPHVVPPSPRPETPMLVPAVSILTSSALPAWSPLTNDNGIDSLRMVSAIRLLSVVCDILLPFHSMMPLAQQIKRSAVIWYIRGNMPEGIEICTSTFDQAINVRYNKQQQHCYSRNRASSLPPPRGIALHLRIIFRILKLQPGDDKDGDDYISRFHGNTII